MRPTPMHSATRFLPLPGTGRSTPLWPALLALQGHPAEEGLAAHGSRQQGRAHRTLHGPPWPRTPAYSSDRRANRTSSFSIDVTCAPLLSRCFVRLPVPGPTCRSAGAVQCCGAPAASGGGLAAGPRRWTQRCCGHHLGHSGGAAAPVRSHPGHPWGLRGRAPTAGLLAPTHPPSPITQHHPTHLQHRVPWSHARLQRDVLQDGVVRQEVLPQRPARRRHEGGCSLRWGVCVGGAGRGHIVCRVPCSLVRSIGVHADEVKCHSQWSRYCDLHVQALWVGWACRRRH